MAKAMTRYILILLSVIFFSSCENTNVAMMTGAASDAVTAITLSDEDVINLAQRAAFASDSKHRVASAGSSYNTRLRKLVTGYSQRNDHTFNFKVYQTKEINAFAMADGTIRIHSGLMDLMIDEELLFVIGHEVGHVVEKHSRKKVVLAKQHTFLSSHPDPESRAKIILQGGDPKNKEQNSLLSTIFYYGKLIVVELYSLLLMLLNWLFSLLN